MTDYTLELSETAENVDRQAWQTLCPEPTDLFMHLGLLSAVESSMAPQAHCWYALFRDPRGRPAAAATLSSYVIDASVLATGIGGRVARGAAKILPRLTQLKILFLGMPFSAGQSHLRFAPGTDRGEIVRRLDALALDKARETKSEIIVAKEFSDQELTWACGLRDLGYRRADSLPMNYMSVTHTGFDDYLGAIQQKKRTDLRRTRKRFDEGGLRRVVCRGEEAAARFDARAHRLYENVLFASETRSECLPQSFFQELARRAAEHVEFIYFYDGDLLLAFGCCVFDDGVYIPLYAGIDYDRNRQHDLYLNMLYDSVDRGLHAQPRELWVGANADDIKHLKLGTYQRRRHLYAKGAWWLARLVLRFGFDLFFPAHELRYPAPEREAVRRAA